MNINPKLNSLNLKLLLAKVSKRYGGHVIFAAILVTLLVYILVVFKISGLSKAEPGPSQTQVTAPLVPKIDQKIIDQLQTLENNNVQLHSLFEKARNNPFQE